MGSTALLAEDLLEMEDEVGLWVVEGKSKGKKELVGNAVEIRAGLAECVIKKSVTVSGAHVRGRCRCV